MAFWEDSLRYLFLPRFRNRQVLDKTIAAGARSRDFFGIAYGEHDGRYDGFKFGDAAAQLDDTLLLIEPTVAADYEAQEAAKVIAPPPPGPGPGPKPGPVPPGGDPPTPPVGPGTPPPGQASVHTFIGTVNINAATAKLRLVEITDEIINQLISDPQATVRITLEINAHFPDGVTDTVKRAVSENANHLGFKNKTWE